jgi:FKBP-type peptidyl-prolyl cis-trans isomerase 2
MTDRQATQGDTVHVHYTGRLDNGDVFDTSRQREPLSFTMGAGGIIPGFEAAVDGLSVGESRSIRIEADQAYGDHRDDLVVSVPRAQAPDGLSPDDRVQIGDRPAVVTEVTDEHVTVDANHPLAGQPLNFDIELVSIDA